MQLHAVSGITLTNAHLHFNCKQNAHGFRLPECSGCRPGGVLMQQLCQYPRDDVVAIACRYNTALVNKYGPSAVAALWATATYGKGTAPYILNMQLVRP